MEHCAGLTLSSDGVVSGEWSESTNSLLLSKIRSAYENVGDWLEDVLVLAGLAYDVLSAHPCYGNTPNFSTTGPSLVSAMLRRIGNCDLIWDIVDRSNDDDFVAATNLARWMKKLPQQTDEPLVFVSGPGAEPTPRKRSVSRSA